MAAKRDVICRRDEQKDEAMCAAEMNVSREKFISSTGLDRLEGDMVAPSVVHTNLMARSV